MSDYIERDKAFNALLKLIPKVDDDGYCWVIRGDAATAIDSIQAADVRPVVKARWIHVPSDGKFRDTCVCSACKKSPPTESWVVQEFNACPYCFADMREES